MNDLPVSMPLNLNEGYYLGGLLWYFIRRSIERVDAIRPSCYDSVLPPRRAFHAVLGNCGFGGFI